MISRDGERNRNHDLRIACFLKSHLLFFAAPSICRAWSVTLGDTFRTFKLFWTVYSCFECIAKRLLKFSLFIIIADIKPFKMQITPAFVDYRNTHLIIPSVIRCYWIKAEHYMCQKYLVIRIRIRLMLSCFKRE